MLYLGNVVICCFGVKEPYVSREIGAKGHVVLGEMGHVLE